MVLHVGTTAHFYSYHHVFAVKVNLKLVVFLY